MVKAEIGPPNRTSSPTDLVRLFEASAYCQTSGSLVSKLGWISLRTESNDSSRVAVHLEENEDFSEKYGIDFRSREEARVVFDDNAGLIGLISTAMLKSSRIVQQ